MTFESYMKTLNTKEFAPVRAALRVAIASKPKGCSSCPYSGRIELPECPDAYTEKAQYCNLYDTSSIYGGNNNDDRNN